MDFFKELDDNSKLDILQIINNWWESEKMEKEALQFSSIVLLLSPHPRQLGRQPEGKPSIFLRYAKLAVPVDV